MKIGITGDLHLPFGHPLYLSFCQDIFEAWDVKHIHHIGDIIDACAWGFWETNPDGLSAESEAIEAKRDLEDWVAVFPKATVSIGNHDQRHFRKAKKAGIPERFMQPYAEVWGTPKWQWKMSHEFDGVTFLHGTGSSGKDAAINRAIQTRRSIIMGHCHSYAGVKHHTNDHDRIFGMNVGCGIDISAYAFNYGKDFPVRPVLGCGVLVDGAPYFEAMPCGPGEKYHKSRASKKRRKTLI